MGDNSHKTPFQFSMEHFAAKRTNDQLQRQTRGIPCHVSKVEKDFVHVMFEPQNGVWTMPTMKIAQAFSPYAREPTQVGDKGTAVPADYYLGGVTGDGAGKTNFFPRGNLTPLVFQPASRQDNPARDYDQYTLTGGPKGVKIIQNAAKQSGSSPSGRTGRTARTSHFRPGRGFYMRRPVFPVMTGTPRDSASDAKTSLTIDDQGVYTLDGQDGNKITTDQSKKRVTVETKDDGQHFIWLGGPGKKPELYAPVGTLGGPAINLMAKVVQGDET